MEKDYGQYGPHIVQIRRFAPDSTDYWENVKGYDDETNEPIMAQPEDKLTMEESLVIFRKLNPTGFSAIYRIIGWHWPEQRA
jgi:hypothetical protein